MSKNNANLSEGSDGGLSTQIRSKSWNSLRTHIVLSLLVLLFLTVLFWQSIFVFNRSGEQGVYWSRFLDGTSQRILGEGTHFKFPWDDIIVYDIRLQSVKQSTVVLSKDGMEMDVDWSVRYRPLPEELPHLHQRLGPHYAERIIFPGVVSSLRQVLGNYRADEIFSRDENALILELSKRVKEHFKDFPVIIKSVLVLKLQLPKDMSTGIVKKLLYEQEMLSYSFRLEAARQEKERLKIEAEGLKKFEEISKISPLKWRGIQATVELSKSPNSKIVVIGTDSNNLPLLLNTDK